MQQVKDSNGFGWRARQAPALQTAASETLSIYPERGCVSLSEFLPAHQPPMLTASPRRKSWMRRFAPAVIGGAVGLAALALIAGRKLEATMFRPAISGFEAAALWAGFGLDQVSVAGHKFTSDADIFNLLDLPKNRSIAVFDAVAARRNIERLPWVANVDITRVFPGRLDIRIKERVASAIWRSGDREVLIDSTGRVLTEVPAGSVSHLPLVIGDGAENEAQALFTTLARYSEIGQRFAAAERVAGRRWNLRLSGDVTVQLPSDGEGLALERLFASREASQWLAGHGSIIDLRTPGRIAARPAVPGPAQPPRVTQLSDLLRE